MCPMVPTFKCGLSLTNFSFAIYVLLAAKILRWLKILAIEPSMGFEPMTSFLPRMRSTD
jgi:hypothetical protein